MKEMKEKGVMVETQGQAAAETVEVGWATHYIALSRKKKSKENLKPSDDKIFNHI